jgi:hypothetical protein
MHRTTGCARCRTTGMMSVLRNASHDAGWLREQRSSSAHRLPASCLRCLLTLRILYLMRGKPGQQLFAIRSTSIETIEIIVQKPAIPPMTYGALSSVFFVVLLAGFITPHAASPLHERRGRSWRCPSGWR